MHLSRLDIQGFKTFAKKTSLSFLPPGNGRFPLTSVVGPNGSGKSNLADAIRWVLGEQSLKTLRGKKSEDIIFSGSMKKNRAGFAEVSITLDNSDNAMPVDYSEVTITRRLYRDGESEYLLNEGTVRLSDIQLLLAQANVGQRSYSVIGQGMIDHILIATPEERKAFFDDATGVKPLQLKRHDAILKLKHTFENLKDVEMLVAEIEPRVRSLKRQVSRLEQRAEVERELHSLETKYYGNQWWQLFDQIQKTKNQLEKIGESVSEKRKELLEIEERTKEVEIGDTNEDVGLIALQKSYRATQQKREQLRKTLFDVEKEIELTKLRAQSSWAPLPLASIVEEIDAVYRELLFVKSTKELLAIYKAIDLISDRIAMLTKKLKRPNPDDVKPDPELLRKIEKTKIEEVQIANELKNFEEQIDSYAKTEKQVRSELIEMQHTLRDKQQQIHLLENERNSVQLDFVRFDERQKNLTREMDEAMKERAVSVRNNRPKTEMILESWYGDIQRLRYKLELIGGIDPEILAEFEDTKVRFEFLDTQLTDLKNAIESTEKIIIELDEDIESQSKKVFGEIQKEFQRYFKILFDGGSCSLVKLTKEEQKNFEEKDMEVALDRSFEDTGDAERDRTDEIKDRLAQYDDGVVGIEIFATPPGKKLKSLNLLSGGERALTSIALIAAIMAVNPSPFVVLDEVDAALDEANTIRFAAILDELSRNSQFIVITHNRTTMEKADVLYGVTMGDDGISSLLSVKFEDVATDGNARR